MVRLVLASHGPMAQAMLASAAMLCGEKDHVHAICLQIEDSVEQFQARLAACIPENEEVLLLVDIPGGTPSNQGMTLLATHPKLRVLAGMNLMMLLDCMMQMEHATLDVLVDALLASGKESIQEMAFRQRDEDELDAMLE